MDYDEVIRRYTSWTASGSMSTCNTAGGTELAESSAKVRRRAGTFLRRSRRDSISRQWSASRSRPCTSMNMSSSQPVGAPFFTHLIPVRVRMGRTRATRGREPGLATTCERIASRPQRLALNESVSDHASLFAPTCLAPSATSAIKQVDSLPRCPLHPNDELGCSG